MCLGFRAENQERPTERGIHHPNEWIFGAAQSGHHGPQSQTRLFREAELGHGM